ncbi:hypothetical protein BH10BAC4_BH10BAC4_12730 [soil metagenome]
MKTISFLKPVFLDDLIRVGNANDGGYIINQRNIDKTRYLIGLGVNADWSFEADFFERKNSIYVYCFDFSVSAKNFFKRAVQSFYNPAESFFWLKSSLKFRNFFQGNKTFYKKGISDYVNDYFIKFNDIFNMTGIGTPQENEIFLKIDIEQSEFRIMDQVMQNSKYINGIVVEFHDIDILWDNFRNIITELSAEFAITHVHGNNCGETFTELNIPRALEISFVKRNLISEFEMTVEHNVSYPITGLDAPNLPARNDYGLDFSNQ